MRIGELSRRAGVSARSLRYYEQQGLLHAERAANGYREFAEPAVVRAANIQGLLEAGLTVEDVREPLAAGCLDRPLSGLPECDGAMRTAAERLAVLDRRVASLQEVRERLAARISEAPAVLDGGAGR
jgi:DNA-binding transcriptional MerR regulator